MAIRGPHDASRERSHAARVVECDAPMPVVIVLLGLFAAAPHEVERDDTALSHEEHPAAVEKAEALGPWPYVLGVGASLASSAVVVGSLFGGVWLLERWPELWAPIMLGSLLLPVLVTGPLTAAAVGVFEPRLALLAAIAAPLSVAVAGVALGILLWWPGFLVIGVGVPALGIALMPVIGGDAAIQMLAAGFVFSYVAGPVAGLLLSTIVTPGILSVRMVQDAE